MTLEVLVSTMHQTDYSLLERMNIQSDAIVINQCDRNEIEEFEFRGHRIKWYSFNERGVGLSRNNALMRSTADIILFADDDVVYSDGYEEKILKEFADNPKYSMILFGLSSEDRFMYSVKRKTKLHWYNCLKYGAVRIAVKREAVLCRNLFFTLLFGGGAKYQSGEDSLFVKQCMQRGMRALSVPTNLGIVKQDGSTWFKGYNEKYFWDKGCLFSALSKRYGKIFGILVLLKNRKQTSEVGFSKALKLFLKGYKEYRSY